MMGLWLERQTVSLRQDLPKPVVVDGEALVRVIRAGICNTDVELSRGYYPFTGILGHEFVGVVEQGPDRLVGRRVVGEINLPCGSCGTCRSGCGNHCPSRSVLGIVGRHGVFAEYVTLPVSSLHTVPKDLSTDAANFTEPLAAALQIREQIQIGSGDRVIVVGIGKLGQLVVRVLQATGCHLVALVHSESAKQSMLTAGFQSITVTGLEEGGFDVAIECTGNTAGFDIARRALRPRGTLVMKSTYAGRLNVDAAALVVDEITLVGSRCGPFEPALRFLAHNTVDVEPLIAARYPLQQALEAFAFAQDPGVLKVLLTMPGGTD